MYVGLYNCMYWYMFLSSCCKRNHPLKMDLWSFSICQKWVLAKIANWPPFKKYLISKTDNAMCFIFQQSSEELVKKSIKHVKLLFGMPTCKIKEGFKETIKGLDSTKTGHIPF